jgi:hypothetical protein
MSHKLITADYQSQQGQGAERQQVTQPLRPAQGLHAQLWLP